jgi:hypothetical protein
MGSASALKEGLKHGALTPAKHLGLAKRGGYIVFQAVFLRHHHRLRIPISDNDKSGTQLAGYDAAQSETASELDHVLIDHHARLVCDEGCKH